MINKMTKLSPLMIAVIVGVLGLVILLLVLMLLRHDHKLAPLTPAKPASDGILKTGDNGAVSCQEFCTGDYFGKPKYKKAVDAIVISTGKHVDINKPSPGEPVNCYCSNDN